MNDWIYYDEEIDQERLDMWYQANKRPLPGKLTILYLGPIAWPPYEEKHEEQPE